MNIEFEKRPSMIVPRAGPYRIGRSSFPVKPLSVGEPVTLTVKSDGHKQVHAIIREIEGDAVTVEVTRRLAGENYKETLVAVGERLRVHERQISSAGLATDNEESP